MIYLLIDFAVFVLLLAFLIMSEVVLFIGGDCVKYVMLIGNSWFLFFFVYRPLFIQIAN